MNQIKTKEELRKWAKDLRSKLNIKRVSFEIENKIRQLDEYKKAKNVMSYMAKDIEISLSDLFKDDLKNWFLPVLENETEERRNGETERGQILVVPYVPSKTKLIKGRFEILEPEIIDNNFFDQIKKKIKLDLIFVPGLCFDKGGNRIGFGAGFYDRFLKLNPESIKIGCCPKECLVRSLPTDLWDMKVDIVVTD